MTLTEPWRNERWRSEGGVVGYYPSESRDAKAAPRVIGATLCAQRAWEYHRTMQVVTGTVIEGKVVLEGASLPEGTVVTVFAKDSEATVRLPPALQAELEEALEEADHEEGISGDELFRKLQK